MVLCSFFKETKALVLTIEETGNPFMQDSDQLFTLDIKNVADQAVVNTVKQLKHWVWTICEFYQRTPN